MITDWSNKKVGIIGAGIEGVSSANFFAKHGALVTILDKKEEKELSKEDIAILRNKDIKFITGKNYLNHLLTFDLLVRSPGVKLSLPEIVVAKEKGVEVTSQTKLFFDLCPCPIIGVTGTKGKGTTSALIYEMLKKSGFDAYLGGNIGNPPFEFLDTFTPQSRVVLELSSFQLQDIKKSPHIAVVLMITSDHLDHHGGTEKYIDAKRNILRFQKSEDYAVINRDYLASHESDVHTEGKVFQVSRERDSSEQGCFVKDGGIWIRMQGTEWKIIDVSKIALIGKHNLENVCAAAMAATLAGATKSDIAQVLQVFTGLPHRLEFVREVNGVRYYDDSIATNPESAIAAIEVFEQPKVLILGGVTEGSKFNELGEVISKSKNIKAIIGIGKEWHNIKSNIKNEKSKILLIEGANDMKTIVAAAAKIAKPGDIVLLSPACKSFDMFKDYKDRGEQFKREVNLL